MSPRYAALVLCFATGCAAAAPRASAEVEAQLRAIRSEQERHAHQLEVFERRLALAEDTVREARLVTSRRSVRIGPDGEATQLEGVEPIPSAATGGHDDPEGEPGVDAAGPARPSVQAAGRAGAPAAGAPFVVRDNERLPAAPAPPIPVAPAGGSRGTSRNPARGRGVPESALSPSLDPSARGAAGAHAPAPLEDSPALRAPSDDPALTEDDPVARAARAGAVPVGERVSSARDPNAMPAYEQALGLARSGQCAQALEALGGFLVRWPDHPYADNAMFWRGQCYASTGDNGRAVRELEGLLSRFPMGNKVPDALYKLAVCYRRLGDEARAQRYAERLAREFPRAEVTARLRDERFLP